MIESANNSRGGSRGSPRAANQLMNNDDLNQLYADAEKLVKSAVDHNEDDEADENRLDFGSYEHI